MMQLPFSGPEQNPGSEISADALGQVRQLLAQNKEVEAIRIYREATNASLAVAVKAVGQIKDSLDK